MAVYRVDVRTDDADTFVQWIREHVPESALVRSVGFGTVKGWYFKNVFSDKHIAEEFHRHWYHSGVVASSTASLAGRNAINSSTSPNPYCVLRRGRLLQQRC